VSVCVYVGIVTGTIFQLGEQKLTTFWLGKQKLVKNNQHNQIQSITLCNMYFSKKLYAVFNGVWSKAPEAGEFSRIFVWKVTLQCVRLLLTVIYGEKKWESGNCRMYTSCSPNNFPVGATAPPCSPGCCTYVYGYLLCWISWKVKVGSRSRSDQLDQAWSSDQ